jgi:hypothetical protein
VVAEGVTPVFWPLLVVLCAKQVLAPSNNKNVQVHLIASVITTLLNLIPGPPTVCRCSRQVKGKRMIPITQKHRHSLTY